MTDTKSTLEEACVWNASDALEHKLLSTYKREPIKFVRGTGCQLIDSKGNNFLDFLAGIAVVSVGHAHPKVVRAISEQAASLIHVSNLFWTEPGMELSNKLSSISGTPFKSFLCNSGTESIECAIKFARKATPESKSKIVCAQQSFHGRTLAALAATGQPAKWQGFDPMPAGFAHATFNDVSSFSEEMDDSCAAVLVEPIQGEGGIHPANQEFLHQLRDLCTQRGILLIFDEIQTGCGRTGSWWAWQKYGVTPDVFVTAKGLANGLPIGACLVRTELAGAFTYGDHGSTFGGSPVPCAAALATLQVIEEDGLIERATILGDLLATLLGEVKFVQSVRGAGLMRAAQLTEPKAAEVKDKALSLGLIVNNVRPDAIRITPPLCITEAEIRLGVDRLKEAIATVFDSKV